MNFLLKIKHAMNFYMKQEVIHSYLWKILKEKFKDFYKKYRKEDKFAKLGLM
jgi:hypothetical protein